MTENMTKMYAAVEFVELPYPVISPHVCVPQSWIRRRLEAGRCTVAYPDDCPLKIKKIVQIGGAPSNKWRAYEAILKLEACSYKEANQYIVSMISNEEGLAAFDLGAASDVKRKTASATVTAASSSANSSNKRKLTKFQPELNKQFKIIDDVKVDHPDWFEAPVALSDGHDTFQGRTTKVTDNTSYKRMEECLRENPEQSLSTESQFPAMTPGNVLESERKLSCGSEKKSTQVSDASPMEESPVEVQNAVDDVQRTSSEGLNLSGDTEQTELLNEAVKKKAHIMRNQLIETINLMRLTNEECSKTTKYYHEKYENLSAMMKTISEVYSKNMRNSLSSQVPPEQPAQESVEKKEIATKRGQCMSKRL